MPMMMVKSIVALCCLLCGGADAYALAAGPARVAAVAPPRAAARMGIMDWLGNMLYDRELQSAKRRCARFTRSPCACRARLFFC